MIEFDHAKISVRRQCALLGISRSGLYYEPEGPSEEDLLLMRLLDEQYTRTPFYGVRRMKKWLENVGRDVGVKRVRRLLRLMGLMAIYCKPRLSVGAPLNRKFPYLLGGLDIRRPNQVWCADITYLRLRAWIRVSRWLSWTGSAATCCPGKCRPRWRLTFACRLSKRRLAWPVLKYRTRIRGVSSPARIS